MHTGPLVLSALDDPDGAHFIAAIEPNGSIAFRVPVPERGHGGCRRPLVDEVVMFSRRPGHYFQVIDFRLGAIVRQIEAENDHHFYGHGVFSPDGNLLYATANHYPSGGGRILIYDAGNEYRLLGKFKLDGIGPHEIRLHPDGQTLVVALGGIKTHPDYDRMKLNLTDMQPALLLIDRESGRTIQRHEPSHHQLSCRHLDVSKEGIVMAGYQFEGPVWETPPLIARLDSATGDFTEIALIESEQAALQNYIASVAIDPASHRVAITAPRGNRAVMLDYFSAEHIDTIAITDVAGAIADQSKAFMFTSGLGGIYRGDASHADRLEGSDLRWDNHLTATHLSVD
ncbi:MAG: DUF1513 domain-containing protein [Pseudomonas sp.]|nr:DUF1513 domain-containing protein [Pseudomonas sp.]